MATAHKVTPKAFVRKISDGHRPPPRSIFPPWPWARLVFGAAARATRLEAIERLLQHEQLTVQDSDVVAAALETFRKRPALAFSDCLLLEVARKAGHLPLGTFDRDLARLDGAQAL